MSVSLSEHLIQSFSSSMQYNSGPFGQPLTIHGQHSYNPRSHGPQNMHNSDLNGEPHRSPFMHVSEETAAMIATLQIKLNQKLGPEYISQRPGPGGGGKLTYVEGWKIINLANEVFGFNGWSSNIVSLNTDFADYNEETRRYNVGVTAIVRITLRDGVYHEDTGYGSLENSKSKGQAMDKCKKEAVTDAIKRALRNFGNLMGNCLYDKQYAQDVVKVKVQPVKFNPDELHRRAEFQKPESVPQSAAKPAVKIEEKSAVQTPQAVPAHIRTYNGGPSKPANGPTAPGGLATPNQTPMQKQQPQYIARNGGGGNAAPQKPQSNQAYAMPNSSSTLGSSGPSAQPQPQRQAQQSYQQISKPASSSGSKPSSNGFAQPQVPPKSVMKPVSSSNMESTSEERHVAFANHQPAQPQPQPQQPQANKSRADESYDFSEDDAFFAAVDLDDPDFGPPIHYDELVGVDEYDECEQSVLEEREARRHQENEHAGQQEQQQHMHSKQQYQQPNHQHQHQAVSSASGSKPSGSSASSTGGFDTPHSFSGQSNGSKRTTANGGFNFPSNGNGQNQQRINGGGSEMRRSLDSFQQSSSSSLKRPMQGMGLAQQLNQNQSGYTSSGDSGGSMFTDDPRNPKKPKR